MLNFIIITQISFALTFISFAFEGKKKEKVKHACVHTPVAVKAKGTEHCAGCEHQDVPFFLHSTYISSIAHPASFYTINHREP